MKLQALPLPLLLLLLLLLVCTSAALTRDGDDVVRLVTKANSVLRKDASLTENEKMLIKEEQMLEKLYTKIAPKHHIQAHKDNGTVQILKEFLKTFDERPALETRGRPSG